jgi:beta propeller repeat protein
MEGNKLSKKQIKLFGLITIVSFIFALFGGLTLTTSPAHAASVQFSESQITTNTASQEQPDVYFDVIVYQDSRNGNWDIYAYTVGAAVPEARVTTNSANQKEPSIFGNIIAYQDDRNGNWDIYVYDLISQTETRITTNTAAQQYPEIDGTRIVWQDNRNGNGDIYMYDLTTQTETRITTTSINRNPSISGNLIAYEKQIFENNAYRWAIYYFNLATNVETQVSGGDKYNPVIDGPHIVYEAPWTWDFNTLYNVVMKDVVSGTTWDPNYPSDQRYPDVYGNIIVYQDDRVYTYPAGYKWSIFLYNLDTQSESQVTKLTPNTGNQIFPAVNYNKIVYMDDRNGNYDIYMTTFAFAQTPPMTGNPPGSSPTPEYAIGKLQTAKSIIDDSSQIPPSDLSGANIKVSNNRRNTLINRIDAAIHSVQAAADSSNPKKEAAQYQSALNQLNSILDKMDGTLLRGTPDMTGSGYTPDWITTSTSQELVTPLITSSIATLQALLEK